MLEIKKGEVVDNWRGGRRVQRVELKLDGDRISDVIQAEIVRQAKQQGITLPDLLNSHSCDPTLDVYFWDGDCPVDKLVTFATLSFYEDFQGNKLAVEYPSMNDFQNAVKQAGLWLDRTMKTINRGDDQIGTYHYDIRGAGAVTVRMQ